MMISMVIYLQTKGTFAQKSFKHCCVPNAINLSHILSKNALIKYVAYGIFLMRQRFKQIHLI